MAQNQSLSTQEVADILHVSKSTIYDLIRRGEIHSYKIGRKVRFTQDDVDAYIARSRHEHSTRPVKLIHDNILIAFEDGANLEARQNMQRGAFYAGRAFTRGCVGYVHAVGHTLGGLYGVAHGLAMAVLLPHVMREFGASAHKRLAELADVCGIGGENEAEKANAFIRWIEETNQKMGLPDSFDMIRDEDIDQMIAWASKEANPLYPVPVVWSKKDFRRFIQSIRR